MQEMQAHRRLRLTPTIGTGEISSGGKSIIARLQEGHSREFQ